MDELGNTVIVLRMQTYKLRLH